MENAIVQEFLRVSMEKLTELCGRIEHCLGMLSEDQVWARGTENENAVGNLALHLCGNVRQWIVSGVGGLPDSRQRDTEFAARGGRTSAELGERLHAAVAEAVETIRGVTPERLTERLSVQKYDVSVLEAIFHVVEHFSMHTGQILFVTKMLTGSDLGFYRHLSGPVTAAHGMKTP